MNKICAAAEPSVSTNTREHTIETGAFLEEDHYYITDMYTVKRRYDVGAAIIPEEVS